MSADVDLNPSRDIKKSVSCLGGCSLLLIVHNLSYNYNTKTFEFLHFKDECEKSTSHNSFALQQSLHIS